MIAGASRSPSSGHVRSGAYYPLKRGEACSVCRALRIKRGNVDLQYGSCLRNLKTDPCEWDNDKGKSKVPTLTGGVVMHQSRIAELENSGLTTLPFTLYNPSSSCRAKPHSSKPLHIGPDFPSSTTYVPVIPDLLENEKACASCGYHSNPSVPCRALKLGPTPLHAQIAQLPNLQNSPPKSHEPCYRFEDGSHFPQQEFFSLVLKMLSDILSTKEKRKAIQVLEGPEAQILIDFLYHLLSLPHLPESAPAWLRKHSLIVLRKLCGNSLIYPRYYTLCGIQSLSHEGTGGFCDIYRAQCPKGHNLCLKVVRMQSKSDGHDIFKIYAREAILWGLLHHPNVVPFYGVFYLGEAYQQVCLVSPWMENGNIVVYLRKNPQVARKPFMYDIASGLKYLHDENVVHGDLKGVNVLVNQSGRACIADFGLSRVRTNKTFAWVTITAPAGHTTGWASPELLDDGSIQTRASDIWAFGCVCYEIQTRLVPFHNCTTDAQIIRKLIRHELPAQPGTDAHLNPMDRVNDAMWRLIRWCWQVEPASRPTCAQILSELTTESTSSLSKPKEELLVAIDLPNGSLCSRNAMRRSSATMQVDLGQVLRVLKGTYTEGQEVHL